MGLFDNAREKREKFRKEEKQKLSTLSEKELLIEILLELKELNNQGKRIARNQVIWSD